MTLTPDSERSKRETRFHYRHHRHRLPLHRSLARWPDHQSQIVSTQTRRIQQHSFVHCGRSDNQEHVCVWERRITPAHSVRTTDVIKHTTLVSLSATVTTVTITATKFSQVSRHKAESYDISVLETVLAERNTQSTAAKGKVRQGNEDTWKQANALCFRSIHDIRSNNKSPAAARVSWPYSWCTLATCVRNCPSMMFRTYCCLRPKCKCSYLLI